MKILITNNSGITRNSNDFFVDLRTGNFALELQKLSHEVTFFGQFVPISKDTNHTFGVIANGLQVSGTKRRKNKLVNYIALYLLSIKAIYKADFVYIFYPNALKYTAFIAKLLNKKYGLYIRGMDDLKGTIPHLLYKGSYCVFTVSDYFTDYINNICKLKLASTIRPMILMNNEDIISDRFYHPKTVYKILFLGRITKEKGLVELLNAISILKEKKVKFHLYLVGQGESADELKQQVDTLKISDFVTFVGGIYESSEIRKCYIEADIFIIPTYHEGFPRSLYEAMTCGTPIITTFVGGISSLMKNKVNCLEIKPYSTESIVDALFFAFNNYEEVGLYAKNGTKLIKEILNGTRPSHAEDLNKEIKVLKYE